MAGVLLVASAPVVALAALLVRLETHGHPIYRQHRVGRDEHGFEVYKLRTMVSGAEHMGAGMAVDAGDIRITRIGALLRRTSIDELPNLVNVLRGEMAIVGPRPTLLAQVADYTPHQRRRLEVKPGLTGWAQVKYRYGASIEDAMEKLRYDLYYIKHLSVFFDLTIVFDTVKVVLFGKGAV